MNNKHCLTIENLNTLLYEERKLGVRIRHSLNSD